MSDTIYSFTIPDKKHNDTICDDIIDIFVKCIKNQDSFTRSRCNDIRNLLGTSFVDAYVKCTHK